MEESKFIKKQDDLAEYEISDEVKGQGKEYKAEPIPKREED